MSYVVANRVFVKDAFRDEFEQRFKKRAGEIDKQPGFERMEILQPRSKKTPYVVLTYWQDEKAFQSWVRSDDFKVAHANPMPKEAFDEGGGLEQYSIIISASS
ncbi:MAG: antibiotic biosynthesis monooxygenase [Pseudomonadota bacterium]